MHETETGVKKLLEEIIDFDREEIDMDRLLWGEGVRRVPPTARQASMLDYGLDSLDRAELAMRVEEQFDMEVSEGDVEDHFNTGNSIARYVREKTGQL